MIGLLRALGRQLRRRDRVHLVRQENGPIVGDSLLAGRHALVTGAGHNIGRSIATEMAKQGAVLYFTDIDAAAIASLQSELEASGASARGFVSDVSQPADVEALCAALQAEGVVVDVLVNNVGISRGGGLLGLAIDEVRAVFEANVFGPLQLTRAVVERLIASGRPGSVLFVTSVHASSTSGWLAYSASKAALEMIIRELAQELAPHLIRVNGIAPGAVGTLEGDELPIFRAAALHGASIHPSYIGRAAVYLAADYFSEFTTGSVLTVDAGLLTRPPGRSIAES